MRTWTGIVVVLLSGLGGVSSATAQPAIAPPFNTDYSLLSLGSVPGVPANYGGIAFLAGDPNTLLIGGAANQAGAAIYSVGVVRDIDGHITGFSGAATVFASAPNIDGGLAYGPGGVLFATTFNNNNLLQFLPGSGSPDKTINLTPFGIGSSVGTLGFVPNGFPGAGGLRIASYNSWGYYSADLVADGSGTYDLANVVQQGSVNGGPEGLLWVPLGSPQFPNPSMLISEYSGGEVGAYQLDANGHPILASRVDFITGLTGAEGAVLDPLTNDFLFSTFGGGNQVIRISGFAAVPEPTTMALVGLGLCGSLLGVKRLRAKRAIRVVKPNK